MKTSHVLIGAAVLWWWAKRRACGCRKNQVAATAPTNGTNWTADAWTRLSGGDLIAGNYCNGQRKAHASADVSALDLRDLGVSPAWDGSL